MDAAWNSSRRTSIFSSAISYWKFLSFDVVGTLVYTTLWATLGYVVGDQAAELLGRSRAARLLLLVGPLALASLIAYRLWRRRRYGPARADVVVAESSCVEPAKAR